MIKAACIAFVLSFLATPSLACTSVSGPATLSSPGLYCLIANIYQSTPGANGIVITSAGVTLEMRGLSVIGPGSGTGNGIYIAPGAHDATIRNGQVTSFMYGVRAEAGADRVRIRDVDASWNSFRGFAVSGSGAWLLFNRAGSIYGYSGYADSLAMAIEVSGPNCVVAFNILGDVLPIGVGESIQISLSQNNLGCQVYNNTIRQQNASLYGGTFGVWSHDDSSTISIHNNIIIGNMFPVAAPATTQISGNIVLPICASYLPWLPTTYAANNTEIPVGVCTDTIPALTAKTVLEPTRAEWWYRLGWSVRTRTGDNVTAKQHYQHACDLGLAEGCKYAAVL